VGRFDLAETNRTTQKPRVSKGRKVQEDYRRAFEKLGHPLTARDAIPPGELTKAEKKLGVQLPAALRDYYLVAGRDGQAICVLEWQDFRTNVPFASSPEASQKMPWTKSRPI